MEAGGEFIVWTGHVELARVIAEPVPLAVGDGAVEANQDKSAGTEVPRQIDCLVATVAPAIDRAELPA